MGTYRPRPPESENGRPDTCTHIKRTTRDSGGRDPRHERTEDDPHNEVSGVCERECVRPDPKRTVSPFL